MSGATTPLLTFFQYDPIYWLGVRSTDLCRACRHHVLKIPHPFQLADFQLTDQSRSQSLDRDPGYNQSWYRWEVLRIGQTQ